MTPSAEERAREIVKWFLGPKTYEEYYPDLQTRIGAALRQVEIETLEWAHTNFGCECPDNDGNSCLVMGRLAAVKGEKP